MPSFLVHPLTMQKLEEANEANHDPKRMQSLLTQAGVRVASGYYCFSADICGHHCRHWWTAWFH